MSQIFNALFLFFIIFVGKILLKVDVMSTLITKIKMKEQLH
jgi:hypothetical protein